jgi:predicted transcriptional regulator of viral defense system
MRLVIEDKVFKKLSDYKRGKIIFSESFAQIGNLESINKALSRLTQKGLLVRLAQGIYLYPKQD